MTILSKLVASHLQGSNGCRIDHCRSEGVRHIIAFSKDISRDWRIVQSLPPPLNNQETVDEPLCREKNLTLDAVIDDGLHVDFRDTLPSSVVGKGFLEIVQAVVIVKMMTLPVSTVRIRTRSMMASSFHILFHDGLFLLDSDDDCGIGIWSSMIFWTSNSSSAIRCSCQSCR